ncbi:MAG: ABC transporter permease [Elusimicrobiota bacterium]|jgi:phospholipid/cholesterol/gamma-HCH transport system permease protein|nr:ABC transporter permease [Elusimicrobiota bacterium]
MSINKTANISNEIGFFAHLLSIAYSVLEGIGEAARMSVETFFWIFRGKISISNTVSQMVEMGWRSLPIVALTSFSTGMVIALQVGTATTNMFNEPIFVGMIMGFSLVLELGPILTAVVVTGRVGAAITAEIGTMKVTEQIDALYTLGTNPVKYLAVPRFLACLTMLPLLTVIANIVGMYGGLIVTTSSWDVTAAQFMRDALDIMTVKTFFHGFIKSIFFSLIIVITACHKGFNAKGGAEGVGKATTSSVMLSLVLILVSDYFLSSLLVSLRIK